MKTDNIYDIDLTKLQKKVKDNLKDKRYIHTIGVRYTAASLAMTYGADITKAQIAGILHDCAKSMSDEEILIYALEHDIEVNESSKVAPNNLLHAPVGAHLAKHKYKIKDEEILSAIRWHTTGRADMNLLEKIIFIADYIEPNRKPIDSIIKARREAFKNLDNAVLTELESTINYLESDEKKAKSFDKFTMEAYNFYKTINKR